MLRNLLFWSHLTCGVTVGLVVLMMSLTGAILTYQRQILAKADIVGFVHAKKDAERIDLNKLVQIGNDIPDFAATDVVVRANPDAPIELRAGREAKRFVNPYSGEIYLPRPNRLDSFFGAVTRWHRWFDLRGANRDWGKAVTGAGNLGFVALLLSGLYLWLPRVFKWAAFKVRVWFTSTPSPAARDFHWHHVVGIWAALPLLLIASTAVVFSYPWANNAIYAAVGEQPPRRLERGRPEDDRSTAATVSASAKNYEHYFQIARERFPDWQSITLALNGANHTEIVIDTGNGGQPQKRHSLVLTSTGAIQTAHSFYDQSTGRQLRLWIRFLHTGEALGVIGQTVAGLASLAAVLMVWTGLAMSIRRLRRFAK